MDLEIITLLKAGKVKFCYKKADGSDRIAYGTRNCNLIPEDKIPKGGKEDEFTAERLKEDLGAETAVKYFDYDINGWRAFKLGNFVGVIFE